MIEIATDVYHNIAGYFMACFVAIKATHRGPLRKIYGAPVRYLSTTCNITRQLLASELIKLSDWWAVWFIVFLIAPLKLILA